MDELGATAAREMPSTNISDDSTEVSCVEAVLQWLTARNLRLAVPQGCFGPTHDPYNTRAPPRCLDYFIVSKDFRDIVSEVHREPEISTASSPIPLPMRISWITQQSTPKRSFVRRKWPGWKPASEGQFSDLLDADSWGSMESIEQDIARAGRVGAARSWSQNRSPCDAYEKSLINHRRTLAD